ncbi:hypothetical protein [uncultured Demequina sp.]|uniref:hypothetical protein n=1 Tax=uncultured Demequina sp. TaxID=693499 RepID=UPI0025E650AC|nr:hypothetical protein [uncultured Demequina sp.]
MNGATPAEARADASDAADGARIEVRALDHQGVREADGLFTRLWGASVMEAPLMIALEHSGAYVAGAFDRNGARMVGACIGYFAQPLGEVLHSHVAGVDPGVARRGVGIAMKLDQRAWALERGLARITWTFDPLVARNAAFNLRRLGVDVAGYLVDFYGDMSDGVNAGQGSDRLLVSWPLARPVPPPGEPVPEPAAASALLANVDGEPHPYVPDPTATRLAVELPEDIEGLRAADPACAARWRGAVRGALAPLLGDGASGARWRVAGFHDHRYLLERA